MGWVEDGVVVQHEGIALPPEVRVDKLPVGAHDHAVVGAGSHRWVGQPNDHRFRGNVGHCPVSRGHHLTRIVRAWSSKAVYSIGS